MSVKIGGLSQKEALAQLGISRSTLFRFRSDAHWPGDDAPYGIINAWVSTKISSSGRKSTAAAVNHTAQRDSAYDPDDETFADLINQQNLNDELKQSQIEKNWASIGKYTLQHIEMYRKEMCAKINRAMDRLFDELEHCELSTDQLLSIRDAIKRCQLEIEAGEDKEIQPMLFDITKEENN